MNQLRVLIVDDEPIARHILRQELVCMDGVTVVGESDNGESALVEIAGLMPDLVFLDIQMPAMGGFELLNRLNQGKLPAIIIVTAFDQHAIRAFEAGAIDYLLKPVSQARLQNAIERAGRLFRHPKLIAENVARLQQIALPDKPGAIPAKPRLQKIIGRAGAEYFLLNPDEVLAFQADGDVVSILTEKKSYFSTQSLRSLEERLAGGSFRRVHRNALVNVNQIRKLIAITSQRWLITLNNGFELVVSKRQARQIRDVLP